MNSARFAVCANRSTCCVNECTCCEYTEKGEQYHQRTLQQQQQNSCRPSYQQRRRRRNQTLDTTIAQNYLPVCQVISAMTWCSVRVRTQDGQRTVLLAAAGARITTYYVQLLAIRLSKIMTIRTRAALAMESYILACLSC